MPFNSIPPWSADDSAPIDTTHYYADGGFDFPIGYGGLGQAGAATGSAGNKRRQRYFVEIDGREFPVESPEHARALLERAKALAPEAADKKATAVIASRKVDRPIEKVSLDVPVIRTNAPLDTRKFQRQIDAIYAQAARDAEIRLYLMRQALDEDDEDVLLAL